MYETRERLPLVGGACQSPQRQGHHKPRECGRVSQSVSTCPRQRAQAEQLYRARLCRQRIISSLHPPGHCLNWPVGAAPGSSLRRVRSRLQGRVHAFPQLGLIERAPCRPPDGAWMPIAGRPPGGLFVMCGAKSLGKYPSWSKGLDLLPPATSMPPFLARLADDAISAAKHVFSTWAFWLWSRFPSCVERFPNAYVRTKTEAMRQKQALDGSTSFAAAGQASRRPWPPVYSADGPMVCTRPTVASPPSARLRNRDILRAEISTLARSAKHPET